ncbi:hypothetical protein SKA53_02371 [Yoonia vestfoldensis SKA53]|uniref:Uncharacterized protein n=1 Tax=Yoonia vestfoldensis SKA53 TaxID=314232 RepID=A3V3Z7_9RHOB|nr:hypothetical protein SKA53_02371 [Yoonia vestfoldensis SKA53]
MTGEIATRRRCAHKASAAFAIAPQGQPHLTAQSQGVRQGFETGAV